MTNKIGRRSRYSLFFRGHTMDYNTQCLLGYASGQGAAIGEALAAMSAVKERDLETWIRAWAELAERVEDRAASQLAAGHRVSARESYLRACTYHRAGTFAIAERDPRMRHRTHRLTACFSSAAALFDHPCEAVAVPYGNHQLPGLLLRPQDDDQPRPTLIVIGGGELYHQELYFWFGAAGIARGWNMLLVDLPGQGSTYLDGLHFEAQTERSMAAVLDDLMPRRGIDPQRVCAVGLSLGGYILLRAAAFEPRLAAIALSTPMPSPYDWLFEGIPMPVKRRTPERLRLAFRVLAKLNAQLDMAFAKWFRRLGVDDIDQCFDVLRGWTVDLSQVRCRVLCLVGEGEPETFHRQTQRAVDGLGELASYRMTTVAEGADGHCQANNFPVLQELVFDWLTDQLASAPNA